MQKEAMINSNNEQISLVKAKAIDMLSRREYSRLEMQEKLIAWKKKSNYKKNAMKDTDFEHSDIDWDVFLECVALVLGQFEQRGWLSDERYVESLMNQKAHRLGSSRLKQELKVKGLDCSLIESALAAVEESEDKRAHDVWSRKYKSLPNDAKEYQKQSRFLMYRGFSIESIKKVLGGVSIKTFIGDE